MTTGGAAPANGPPDDADVRRAASEALAAGVSAAQASAARDLGADALTSLSPDVWARLERGEDVEPLVRTLAAAGLGVACAVVIDAVVPNGQTWAALGGALSGGGPSAAGLAAVLGLASLAALLFTYGQVRRFIPAPPAIAGMLWAAATWLVGGPLLLSRATWVCSDPADIRATLSAALVLVVETAAGVLAFGAILGVLNPRRPAGGKAAPESPDP